MDLPRSDSASSGRAPSDLVDRYCAGDTFARRLLEAGSAPEPLPQGQVLFRQGDPGNSMVLLLRGRLAVRLEHPDGTETQLAELGPGALAGEMALLTGQPRTASVYAVTDVEVVRCSRASYERLSREYPEELAGFTHNITRRMQEVQLATALAGLFGGLAQNALRDLQDRLDWFHLSHGEVLFRQGDPGDAMYIVVSGRLRITTAHQDEGERVVGEVAPGEIVGELGLLSEEPRSATAIAIRETNLARMTLAVFEQLAERHPLAMMRMTRLIVRRQQAALRVHPAGSQRALALSLVGVGPGIPIREFAEKLAACLGAAGTVLTLDSASVDDILGKREAAQADSSDPTGLVLSAWLSEQESRHLFLLYVADPTWTQWSERCVCQADRVLILADALSSPELGPVEEAIRARKVTARQELVLFHPSTCKWPAGTERWLNRRHLHAYHHLRLGDQQHLERLARRLSGRAIGLALSGGGARGFAHVGVLRAIEEMGIPLDVIGGTSMGALLGAGHALGRDWKEMTELARKFANPRQLFDYTLPLTSLMSSHKVTRVMRAMYGDRRIEDLWRPFFCVSSNLTRAEPMVHRSGPVWKAVRTSIAIPGVWSPMLHGTDVLADGGAMNNFPVDLAHEMCEGGPVLGVNVCPLREMTKRYDFGPSVSGWRVLWSRLNPFVPRMQVPSLVGCLVRAQEINSVSRMRYTQSLADVVIEPDVSRFGVLDFASFDPIIQIGYQAAREQLGAWQGRP